MASKRKTPAVDLAATPPKKARKSRPSFQHFKVDYTKEYPCVVRSANSSSAARCTYCETDFSIAHGGRFDIEKHVRTVTHKKKAAEKPSKPLTVYFKSATAAEDDQSVILAECLFTSFLVEHNVPISAADHAGPLFWKMFPGNAIAQEYKYGRTKTTAIVKCLAHSAVQTSASAMSKGPFILGADGSQEGGDKYYPIVVWYYDVNGSIHTELLANPTLSESSTGANIFSVLDTALNDLDIDWKNCLAFVCDNANVMTGHKKGVISSVRKVHKNVHLAGCVCHLLNIAAKKATKAFQGEFDFDDILRQIAWYINKSSNRQHRFQKLQEKCGTPLLKVVDHCPTRWLSLGLALQRLIQQWEPLKLFFAEECTKMKEKSTNPSDQKTIKTRVNAFLQRRTGKLYASFLSFAMEKFEEVNKEMQTDKAKIHEVQVSLEKVFRKLCSSFLVPSALMNGPLLEVNFRSKNNLKAGEQLHIGTGTKLLLGKINKKVQDKFHLNVVRFYQEGCGYMKEKIFPVGHLVWTHAEVADIRKKDQAKFSSVVYFVQRFPCLLQQAGIDAGSTASSNNLTAEEIKNAAMDNLQEEFSDYQSLPSHLMPAETKEGGGMTMEDKWAQIAKLKVDTGAVRFKALPWVMLGILLLPVSNSACERVFSLVRKNKTASRSSMGQQTTEALLVLKTSNDTCFDKKFSGTLLKKCKSATSESLNL